MNLTLKRTHFLSDCIIGTLEVGDQRFFTLEPKWLGNRKNISCIPEGLYPFTPHGWEENSIRRFVKTWHVRNVPGRSFILFHAGNSAEDTEGCILVGMGANIRHGRGVIMDSAAAMDKLREALRQSVGTLNITKVSNDEIECF